ncbi:MAG: LemA family protein [Asticcacaulis sp.]
MIKLKRFLGLAAVVAAAVSLTACDVNRIPTEEENAKRAFSDVQDAYQRRNDLVPNLVATVQGAAIAERGTLTEVVEARAKATSVNVDASTITDPAKFQQFQQAQDGMSSALGRLMVVVERYPDLKSQQGFITLQSQLEGAENRISISRRDYNAAAQSYNTTLRTFPQVLLAKTIHSGSKPMAYFQATAGADKAPTVDFSGLSNAETSK